MWTKREQWVNHSLHTGGRECKYFLYYRWSCFKTCEQKACLNNKKSLYHQGRTLQFDVESFWRGSWYKSRNVGKSCFDGYSSFVCFLASLIKRTTHYIWNFPYYPETILRIAVKEIGFEVTE